jgi:hypothetical protein
MEKFGKEVEDMIDRGAFLMGWRVGQLIRGLRNGGIRPLYNVSFVNGILYISNAPARQEGNILNLKAAAVTDAGGE